jgi:peroxiredoxin/predicted 2-oxoglutarate/Fe(II)-dependent dioxygenase YbiX
LGSTDRLEAGDRIAAFTLPDVDGKPVNPLSDHLAGRPLLLIFDCAPQPGAPGLREDLAALAEQAETLAAQDVLVLAVTRRSPQDNRRLAAKQPLPCRLLSDPAGRVYAACGLDPATVGRATVTLALDSNLRVLDVIDGGPASRWKAIAGALARYNGTGDPAPHDGHAPVLVLPRVLTPDDCAHLVQVWHRPVQVWEGDGLTTQGFNEAKGDFKVRNSDYGKVTQYLVRDPALQRYLDAKLQRRLLPEIQKVFQTRVDRREDYRIAGYEAAEGGVLGAHRDNPTKETRHRRFTFCVTLNAGEFEGGGLRFREYSEAPYLVPTGSAIVWSCSLLHEVLPVTSGKRFILGTHLFKG